MSHKTSPPFIGLRMHKNQSVTGRRSSTPAKQVATYFAYGRQKQNQLDAKQRGEWWGPDGRVHDHRAVMAWAKEAAMRHRYTFQAVLSVPQAQLTGEQFCQAMGQSGEIAEWRLMPHADTAHCHAHVLFFREKRLDKNSFLAWQTAVREELSKLEQQQLSLPHSTELQKALQLPIETDQGISRAEQMGTYIGY